MGLKKSDELTTRECRALCGICPAGCGVVVTYDDRGRIANVRPDENAELGVICKLGCTIPPNVDTYWVGDAGPGPSYIEAGGDKHLYTNKTVRYMVYNLVYFANLVKEHPIPTNLRKLLSSKDNYLSGTLLLNRTPMYLLIQFILVYFYIP